MLNSPDQNSMNNPGVPLVQSLIATGRGLETAGLLAALHEGWQILETAKYLAHGINAEGQGYLLTLYNPHQNMTMEWDVAQSSDVDTILAFEYLHANKM